MPGQHAGSHFGQDSYPRISTTTELLLEASEMLPYEPMYQPLVPFVPPSLSTGGGGTLPGSVLTGEGVGSDDWKKYPERLDLFWYQGDDVQIPLYFRDPSDPTLDLSAENDYEWKGEIRVYHRYFSTLVNDFIIDSDFIPATGTEDASTLVTLFLPRWENVPIGTYPWDLMTTGPYTGVDLTDVPAPLDLPEDEVWPPTDEVKTWLYGYVHIVPRLSRTDWLPVPPNAVWTGQAVVVTPEGWAVGPNGRVP